jgi:mgtE-like transporter
MNFRDVEESFIALVFCTFGALIAGLIMGYCSGKLALLPALILLIPPSIGLRGNIYASLGSRLGSYLHTGRISPSFKLNPRITENIYSSTFLLLVFSILNGFLAAQIAFSIGIATLNGFIDFRELVLNLVLISALSGFFSAIFMIPSTFVLAIGSYRWGWNPDNVTAPLITLLGDLITLPLIFVSADIVFMADFTAKTYVSALILLLAAIFFLLSIRSGEAIGRRIIRESVSVLLFCTFLQFGAGTILGKEIESFIAIAGLLTIVPAFLEDGGAMGGVLAARLSSMLHLGLLQPSIKPPKEVFLSFGVMHLLALAIFALIGIFGYAVNYSLSLPTPPIFELILVTIIAGQLLMFLLDFMSYYFSIISFRKGLDPDNVGIPLITSFMDVLGTGCLVLVLQLLDII